MKVCIYARVACPDQHTLDCQSKILKAFASEYNLDVVDVAAEFGSGICADRPELSRVLCLAAERKIDAVLVTDISRIFRNGLLYHDFEKRMKNFGVKIFALDRLQRML